MRSVVVGLVATFGLATSLSAQALVPGTWTGSITPPGEAQVDVGYRVWVENDTTRAALVAPDGTELHFRNLRFEEGNLRFTWGDGLLIHCDLKPTPQKGYKGECTDDDGDTGTMEMIPPQGT